MDQSVESNGNGVQIAGDGNTVTIVAGRASLALTRPHTRKAEPKTELELLRVDIRATTLVGRATDNEALDAWLASDRPIAFRCLVARAGTGKTRLAVELCERAERAGWTAGFVQAVPFQTFVAHAADWRWTTKTLVFVDYAASYARDLRTWLEILAAGHYPGAPELRVLLLERHADAELGWFADLLRATSFSAPSPADLADPPLPVPLASLGKLEDRRALLAETMRRAAAIAGRADAPQPPAPGADPEFDRRLANDAIDNEPLYLMMAGTEAIQTGAPAALRLTRTDLATRAAARERARLERLAAQGGLPPALLTHLALCVTLQGGCQPQAAEELLREEVEALSLPSPLAPIETIQKLAEAMPASATREIDALRPDLVGEAFLLAAMRTYRSFPAKETAIVARAWRRAPAKVTATLVRTAQDFSKGDHMHEAVRWLDALVGDMLDFGEVLGFLAAMPMETVALRRVAASASRLSVRLFRALEVDPLATSQLALALTGAATRLSAVGECEEALDAAREGVGLFRELASAQPDEFRPALALSLNNFAVRLNEVGQRDEALEVAREGTNIYRDLALNEPKAFLSGLAASLNNLANNLSKIGQHDAAFETAYEAIEIRRKLAARWPQAYRSDLAGSLNNLANILCEIGHPEAALDAAREAVEIRRELAAQRPDAFLPSLAMNLNNLANNLNAVGQHKAALDTAHEAVKIYRDLATQQPDAFRPDFSGSLNNFAAMLGEHGMGEAALDAAREAIEIYRELAAKRPDAFLPDLAGSLNNLTNILSLFRPDDATLGVARETIDIYRKLAAQRPNVFRSDLAGALVNFAASLREVGQLPAALGVAREAANVFRELDAQRPDAFRPDLTRSIAVFAMCLFDLDFPQEAKEMSAEAIAILEPVFFRRPMAFAPLMITVVRLHLTHCRIASREPDAVRLKAIIEKLEELSEAKP